MHWFFCDTQCFIVFGMAGLIQNSDTEVIGLVRDLVESHITGENTLILVTVPMSGELVKLFLPSVN